MKQVTFAVGLLALGLALGLVLPQVFAQSPQAERGRERAGVGAPEVQEVQEWEQFCELHKWSGKGHMIKNKANPSASAHGKNGYQLVTSAGAGPGSGRDLVLCYRRPAR